MRKVTALLAIPASQVTSPTPSALPLHLYASQQRPGVVPVVPGPVFVAHDGHDPHDDEEGVLRLHGFWRILKECKIAMGNVKVKMPVAVFDRTHVQGKRRVMYVCMYACM